MLNIKQLVFTKTQQSPVLTQRTCDIKNVTIEVSLYNNRMRVNLYENGSLLTSHTMYAANKSPDEIEAGIPVIVEVLVKALPNKTQKFRIMDALGIV